MKRWPKRIIIYGTIIALSGAIYCIAESFIERRQAEELLTLVGNVQVGVAQKSSVILRTESFKRYQSAGGREGSRTYDQFMFQNYGLAFLHLAPHKMLWIQVDYDDDLVVGKTVHFAEAPNRGAILTDDMTAKDSQHSDAQFAPVGRQIMERGTLSSPTYMLTVRDDSSVPATRRHMDWSIDVSCMAQLGQCGDFRKILRGAFE